MLTIKDTIIANTLLDQRKIESVILLPDRQAGREVIEKNSSPGCYEAFLMNGDQLLGRPSFKMYACRFKNASIFVKDTDGAIQQKKNEIAKYSDQLSSVKEELRNLSEQINANKRLKNQNDRQLEVIRREQLQLNNVWIWNLYS